MVDKRLEIDIVANDRASRPIKNLQSTIIRFVGAVSASLAALRAVVFPINAAREFERVLRDVQKTTGFVNTEIEILGQQLLNLSRRVDTSANDLGRIAAAAGQLGLGEAGGQAILQFTESIARAATTLDLTAEQAATSFAKIGSIFNIPIENTERLISTINELSNTTTATADQLLDVVRRVGTVAGEFEDVAALAAQAIQLGLSPETAGTSLVKIFSRFESDADKFAEAFGITVGEFLGKGAIERWEFYLGELAKLSEDEAAKLINTLSGSGRIFALVDKQVQDAANGFAIFRNAQENARRAFVEGTSAIEEYESISQSLQVQLDILRNNFAALGTELGLRLVPTLVETVQRLQEFLQTERARVFFDELGGALISLVNILEAFVNIVTSLPAGTLGTIFGGLTLVATIKAVTAAIGGISSILQSIRQNITANAIRFDEWRTRVANAARGGSLAFIQAQQQIATATRAATGAVSSSVAIYEGATAALGAYVDATQSAVVAQSGLADAARRAQVASAQGAGAQSALGAGTAQQRVAALQQELQLISQKRVAQEQIVAASQREIANLNARAAILKKADRLTGTRNAISRRGLEILQQQKAQQEAIIAGANRRLLTLQSQGVALRAQLVTVEQVARVQAAAAVQAEVADKKRIANLTLITRLQLAFNSALAGTAAGGLRASGALTTVALGLGRVARGLRVLTPVVRVATAAFRGLWAAIGGPIGIAIAAVIFFGDQLKAIYDKIVGNTRTAEASLTEAVRIEARRREGLYKQQIAALESLRRDLSDPGFGLVETGVDVTAEARPTGTFDEQNRFFTEAGENLKNYSEAAAGARVEIRNLEGEIELLNRKNKELKDNLFDAGESAAEFSAKLQLLGDNEERIDKLNQQIVETRRLLGALEQGAEAAAKEITDGITKNQAEFIGLQLEFVKARDRLGELQQQARQLEAFDIRAKVEAGLDADSLASVRRELAAIFQDETFLDIADDQLLDQALLRVRALTTAINDQRKAVVATEKAATKFFEVQVSESQKAELIQKGVTKASQETLQAAQDQLDTQEKITKELTDREKDLRDRAPQILAQKFAYDEVLKSLQKTAKAAEDNRKAAEGIFDNTAAEARALNQELENTQRNLDKILRLRVKERDLTRDIEQGEEGIADITEEIEQLQQQLVETSDVYQRNKIRDRIATLESKKALEETLLIERQRNRATLEIEDFFKQLPGLTAEAREAAQEGQVAPLQAIKDQIDQGIKDADAAIADLANLQDADGNFLFREDEIQEFKDALTDASADYTDALPEINKTLEDAALAAERQIAEQIKTFTEQNSQLLKDFKDLVAAFPAVGESLEILVAEWEKVNQPLINAIKGFGTQTQASLLGGQGIPANFAGQLNDLWTDATTAATRSLVQQLGQGPNNPATVFADGVQAALGGADLTQYASNIRKAHELAGTDGANSIKLDKRGGFYGGVKDISTLAIQDALRDVQTSPELVRQRRAEARLPSERLTQELEPTIPDADPTEQTLAAVLADLQAAQAAALDSEPVKKSFYERGKDLAAGFRDALSTEGPLGGLLEGAASLLEQFSKDAAENIRAAFEAIRPSRLLGIQGNAEGGLITGPGTATSDSILARLSNGEYVSDARTVGHFGPDFFAMLKRMARGSGSVTSRFSRDIPGFARGGLVTGGSSLAPVNIHLPGAGSFPMLAETNTIDQVSRAAERERLKRGRRKG